MTDSTEKCAGCGTTVGVIAYGRTGHPVPLCERDYGAIAGTTPEPSLPSLRRNIDRQFVAKVFFRATLAEREAFLNENLDLCREFVDAAGKILK
jgi:hypothetical protein